jgi:hypothetical protein
VKSRMVYGILLVLTALRTNSRSSLRMGKRFFSMMEDADFSLMDILLSGRELISRTIYRYWSRLSEFWFWLVPIEVMNSLLAVCIWLSSILCGCILLIRFN